MSMPVALDVAFTPHEVGQRPNAVGIVIDVLRATSTMVTLFDRGAASVGLAPSPEAARRTARAGSGVLLCGEVGGLPPYGFDHGNSPAEFARLDLSARHVVMATTNGTAAVRACESLPVTLIGALLNANAVIREALLLLLELPELVLVCSGVDGRFVLDDAVAAGYLCHILINEARVRNLPVKQSNAAIAAYRLYHSYPNLLAALNESTSAENLYAVRLEKDVKHCARTSVSKEVPRLSHDVPADWHERQGLYLL